MLSKQEVKHVAGLARLDLTEEDAEKFSRQLNEILGYMKILDEVDTSEVSPTSQVTGLKNVSRSDKVEGWCGREEMLSTTSLPVENYQIKVKPVITNN